MGIKIFLISYIDPNTGGTLFQFLLPFLSAIGAGIIIFWRKIKNIFNFLTRRKTKE